jgi:hypothetical protein
MPLLADCMIPGGLCHVCSSQWEMQRVLLSSGDGWEAEVALVTYAPLKDLMLLRDFRLPGEDSADRARRANDSTFY